VLALPYIEINNPLMWTILAHEYGHFLENKYEVSLKVCEGFGELEPKMYEIVSSWVKEIFADILALHVMGPSYYFSFVNLFMLEPYGLKCHSKSHPSPLSRILLMHRELEKKNLNDEAVESYFSFVSECTKIDDLILHNDSLITSEEEKKFIEMICVEAIKYLPCDLPGFSKDNLLAGSSLAKRLSDGIPISSKRILSDEEILDTLNCFDEGSISVYQALETVQEEPNNVCEIMYASWLYWHEYLRTQFRRSFSGDKSSYEYSYDEFKSNLDLFDDLILKSIQTAAVHRFFFKGAQ